MPIVSVADIHYNLLQLLPATLNEVVYVHRVLVQ